MTFAFRVEDQALEPMYETLCSAGFDLKSSEDATVEPGQRKLVGTGLFITGFSPLCLLAYAGTYEEAKAKTDLAPSLLEMLPELQIRPRSGLAYKAGITVLNAPGTIDADYRNEIKVNLFNTSDKPFEIKKGDRIAQAVVAYVYRPSSVAVKEQERQGGHGSTGQ